MSFFDLLNIVFARSVVKGRSVVHKLCVSVVFVWLCVFPFRDIFNDAILNAF